MKSKLIWFTFTAFIHSISVAQQDPQVSQYNLNSSMINPAYSGLHNRLKINTNFRRQWNGLPGNPKTDLLTISSSILENMLGGGLVVSQDDLGVTSLTSVNLALSYQIALGRNQTFSFGLQGGLTSIRHDQDELTLRFLDDPDFPLIEQRASSPNFGAGLVLMADNYYLGFSIPRMLNTAFDDGLGSSTVYKRHYYLQGAFTHKIAPNFILKPNALMRYVDGSPLSFDLGVNIRYNQIFWFGLFTRNFNTQGALLQFIINEVYQIGYSIEVPTASHLQSNFVTHEISIGLDLAIGNQNVYLRDF
ncbi:MAG: type IX secretion system membrane protein PorP/SprF [Bacteroidota bacterium]